MKTSFTLIIIAAGLLICVIRTAVNIVRAKKAGIIRLVGIAKISNFICLAVGIALMTAFSIHYHSQAKSCEDALNDINERGYAALAEYSDVTEEEFLSEKSEEAKSQMLNNAKIYRQYKIDEASGKTAEAAAFAVFFLVLAAGCGAAVTKDGYVYFWDGVRSCKAFAHIKGNKIRFYNAEDGAKFPLSLPVTKENTELFRFLILPEVTENADSADKIEQI